MDSGYHTVTVSLRSRSEVLVVDVTPGHYFQSSDAQWTTRFVSFWILKVVVQHLSQLQIKCPTIR